MKINQQEDDIESTVTGLKWLSVRNNMWDDEEPLMNNSNSSLHSVTSPRFGSPVSSPIKASRKKQDKLDYTYKNAQDALIGSILAVINFLGTAGVPKPSCDQLQKNLTMGRYFAVLKRVQDYIQCIPSESEDETLAKIHLAVTAWEALCRLKAIEYKRAYKNCFQLRYELKGTSTEIKQAIAVQVEIAEQSTACQKKLYLVQKWQRHLLRQMKRSSAIEPQGYQPIRCL